MGFWQSHHMGRGTSDPNQTGAGLRGGDRGQGASEHKPRLDPPERVETSEEAQERLELDVERLLALQANLREGIADDSVFNKHLEQSVLSLHQAINRIEELEENKSTEGQARTIARTALRRYGDIDGGETIGGRADEAADRSLDEMISALEHYASTDGIDGTEAQLALHRIHELTEPHREPR
jgi:hypothetical protein